MEKAEAIAHSIRTAKSAGLRYVSDEKPGIRRRGAPGRFSYVDAAGKPVKHPDTLARIRGLVIPPAWQKVWVSPSPDGHIQATGLDARGRKQYRYHPQWRATRDGTKYARMAGFARTLPRIRRATRRHLRLPGLPREKVLAAVVQVLDRTAIRVGNEEYKRSNHSFGLTTLQDRHVKVAGGVARFEFRGKSGVWHRVELEDRRLARIIKDCRDIPGQDLFQYLDDAGGRHDVTSTDVNDYLRSLAGDEYTAKDFRTWAGTLCAAMSLCSCGPCGSEREGKKRIVEAVKATAERLGNRPATCRKFYVHPVVLDSYLCGELTRALPAQPNGTPRPAASGLSGFEKAVLQLLEKQTRANRRSARA